MALVCWNHAGAEPSRTRWEPSEDVFYGSADTPSTARAERDRCPYLFAPSFVQLGNTRRAGIAFDDRRAVHLVSWHPASRCFFLRSERNLGSDDPRPPTMAKRTFVATGGTVLAVCRMGRFRAPLTQLPQSQLFGNFQIARTLRAQLSDGLRHDSKTETPERSL